MSTNTLAVTDYTARLAVGGSHGQYTKLGRYARMAFLQGDRRNGSCGIFAIASSLCCVCHVLTAVNAEILDMYVVNHLP